MKEYRKFIHDPPFKPIIVDDEVITARSICLIPYKHGNKYFVAIGVEEVYIHNDKKFNRGNTLQQVQIIGNVNSKLFVTIRGIVNGNITGETSEMLMMDLFVNMILNKRPDWINEFFPDWDYATEFKLSPIKIENNDVIETDIENDIEPLKNMTLRVIKGGLCSEE